MAAAVPRRHVERVGVGQTNAPKARVAKKVAPSARIREARELGKQGRSIEQEKGRQTRTSTTHAYVERGRYREASERYRRVTRGQQQAQRIEYSAVRQNQRLAAQEFATGQQRVRRREARSEREAARPGVIQRNVIQPAEKGSATTATSVFGGLLRVFAIIIGMAILYLVVTHGQDTGNAITGFGGFLVNLTSNQPLFVKAGTQPGNGVNNGSNSGDVNIPLPDLSHLFGNPPAPFVAVPQAPANVSQSDVNSAFASAFSGILQIHPDWSPIQQETSAWAALKKAGYPIPTGAGGYSADNPAAYGSGLFGQIAVLIDQFFTAQNATQQKATGQRLFQ